MLLFVLKRLLATLPLLFGVILVTFFLMRVLPGDPAAFYAHTPSASDFEIRALREKLGLDLPLFQQFTLYVRSILRGDLGNSLTTGQPVVSDLLRRLPASMELTLVALVLTCLAAIPLGVLAATRAGSWTDHLTRFVSTAGVCMPTFATGLLLIFVFYYLLRWVPKPVGRIDIFLPTLPRVTGFFIVDSILAGSPAHLASTIKQLVLPSLTMAIFSISPLARMTRAAMLGVLQSDFVRAVRAASLPRRTVLFACALPNALLSIITTLGVIFSYMLGANVLVEKVFAWPGVGSYALEPLVNLDFVPVQGFILTMAFIYLMLNCLIDMIYGIVDPRVRVA